MVPTIMGLKTPPTNVLKGPQAQPGFVGDDGGGIPRAHPPSLVKDKEDVRRVLPSGAPLLGFPHGFFRDLSPHLKGEKNPWKTQSGL